MHSLNNRTTSSLPSLPSLRSVWKRPPTIGILPQRVVFTRVQRRRRLPQLYCQKDKGVGEFQKLLNTLQSAASRGDRSSTEWLEDVQQQGRSLAAEVENLRVNLSQKTSTLTTLENDLNELRESLKSAEHLQTTTATQLEMKTTEVEMLRSELEQLQKQRTEEVNSSMERYQELEDALAHVESELQTHSEIFQGKESGPVDVSKLTEIVHEQDKVFQNLVASLRSATEGRHQAEKEAEEAKRMTEELKSTKARLLEDQELLSKELSQLQILYAEKEIEWNSELQSIQDLTEKLKEESVGLETTLAIKDKKLTALEGSFGGMKSQLNKAEGQTVKIGKQYAELKGENQTLQNQLRTSMKTPQHEEFAKLQVKLSRLEVAVPVLESEIENLLEKQKTMDETYQAMEKDYLKSERRCAQLETRSGILQNSKEEKSKRLIAAHKERRALKAEVSQLKHESTSLHDRLRASHQEIEKLKKSIHGAKTEQQKLEQNYQKQVSAIAERQQEAQNVLLYHQEHKNENKELLQSISKLEEELKFKQNEIQKLQSINAQEMDQIQQKLASTEDELRTKEAEIMQLQSQQTELQIELTTALETAKTEHQIKDSKITELESKLLELDSALKSGHSNFEGLKTELTKLQNELTTRQRIISARDQEVVTLKDDARLANERVEALRGQITSMQTLNREMEVEMAETDSIVSKMNDRMKELQEETDEKDQQISELNQKVSELEVKSKQVMDQFTDQISSLEEFSKQQEGLVENFFEEKQSLESTVADLKAQLEVQSEDKEESKRQLNEVKEQCTELENQLMKSEIELKSVRQSAAEEIAEAEKILARAESVTQSVQGTMEEASTTNGAIQSSSNEAELLQKISDLESSLQKELKTNSEFAELTQKLEEEVLALQEELRLSKEAEIQEVVQQSVNGTNVNAENELILMSKRLSKSLAAEEAALAEIQRLRDQVKYLQDFNQDVHQDEKVGELRELARQLEKENESLRKAASKRNQILAQSRHFIQQYLERSVNSLTDLQP